jgi:hypothetical protein
MQYPGLPEKHPIKCPLNQCLTCILGVPGSHCAMTATTIRVFCGFPHSLEADARIIP